MMFDGSRDHRGGETIASAVTVDFAALHRLDVTGQHQLHRFGIRVDMADLKP